jgi:hypothetical protein
MNGVSPRRVYGAIGRRRWMLASLALAVVGLLLIPTANLPNAVANPPAAAGVDPREEADFNGDGYADLVIAVTVQFWQQSRAGVHVVYGSAGGLRTSGSTFLDKQDLPGMGRLTSQLGATMVASDFNGDGYSDLALSTPRLTVNGQVNAGAVHVIYGSSSGLSATNAQIWSQASSGVAGTAEPNDLFGAALVAADFGGGSEADLVIGVPREDLGTVTNAGSVHVLLGSASGLTAANSQVWTQNSAGVPGSNEAGDHFGSALGAGNFDGKNRSDLAVGTPDEAIGTRDDAGMVVILYSTDTALSATGSQAWSQDTAGVPDAAEPNDHFGSALAAGELSSQAHDDLAVSAVGERYSAPRHLGAVYVLRSSTQGLTSTSIRRLTPAFLPNPDELSFGQSLAIADFGGSCAEAGCEDLAIGAPENPNYGGLGLVYIAYYGGDFDQTLWLAPGTGPDGAIFGGLGSDLAAANFGYDQGGGFADLAIGAPQFSYAECGCDGPGAVHVLPGSDDGLKALEVHTLTQADLGVPDERAGTIGTDLNAGGSP